MKPEPTVIDWLDNLELSHDRHLMLCQVDPEHLDDPPPLLLEEYDSSQELDDLSPGAACGSIRRTCQASSRGSRSGYMPTGSVLRKTRASRPLRGGVNSIGGAETARR